jgi:hypothetical protein
VSVIERVPKVAILTQRDAAVHADRQYELRTNQSLPAGARDLPASVDAVARGELRLIDNGPRWSSQSTVRPAVC